MKKIENKNSKNNDQLSSIKHIGKILKTVAKGVGALGYYTFKSIPLISQIKGAYGRYTTGDGNLDAELLHRGIMSNISLNKNNLTDNNNETVRFGHFYLAPDNKFYFINDDMFSHDSDTVLLDLNFDAERLLNNTKLENIYKNSYKCTDKQYYPEVSDLKRNNGYVNTSSVEKDSINNTEHTFNLTKAYRKHVLLNWENECDDILKCAKQYNGVDKVFVNIQSHRSASKKNDRDYKEQVGNLTPKDYIHILKKLMLEKNIKTIIIHEQGCFHNNELMEQSAKAIKETGFEGNIVVRRNINYDKVNVIHTEVKFENKIVDLGFVKLPKFQMMYNRFSTSGEEYIVCNKDGYKCITENEAREIIGGSYEQNLEFNKKHGRGDKPANEKCQPKMDEINEKYFKKEENKIKKNDNANVDKNKENVIGNGVEDL